MKPYDWSDEKNEWLRQERGVTFEDIVFHLSQGGLLDTIEPVSYTHLTLPTIYSV